MIRRSWERCKAMQVDASRRAAPLFITRDAQLDELRDANEPLLRASRPIVARLTDHLSRSGYVVVVADAQGCILDIDGDPEVRARLARVDFLPGGAWSENAAGTNAIGTVLADRRPVQLMGAEHFCDGWTNLTCTAVPINHPYRSEIVGVLDITGDYRLIRSHLTSLLAIHALEIEARLRAMLGSGEPSKPHSAGSSHHFAAAAGRRPFAADQSSDARALALATGAISSSLDLNLTLETVAEQTATLLGGERGVVCLFRDDSDHDLIFRIWSLAPQSSAVRTDLASFLARSDAVTLLRERGQPAIVADVLGSTLFEQRLASDLRIGSVALLALTTARGVIGFIAATRQEPHDWAIGELRYGSALAAQAATAVDNALLFDSLRKHNRHIEAINSVAELLGGMQDPTRQLDALLRSIAEIMELDAGLIYLYEPKVDRMRLVAHHGVAEPARYERRDLCRPVLEPKLTRVFEGDNGHPNRSLLVGECRDVLSVPLADGESQLGVLELGSLRSGWLDHDDLATLAAIGHQLFVALTNARLVRVAGEIEALRQADSLKSEFLATVSHDLRSPLTAIRASVDGLLDQRSPLQAREHDLLLTISVQATRLGRLVDRLLDVSQIEAGALCLDREWLELPALVDAAAGGIAALYGASRIRQRVPPDVPLLFVDYDRFVQVLYNLLDNACKYAPSAAPVEIDASWTNDQITIGVADRGPGIPPSERENVFRRFYRPRARAGVARSTSLGLAICRGIVEAHSGAIWFEDRPGGGSFFRFSVPRVRDRANGGVH